MEIIELKGGYCYTIPVETKDDNQDDNRSSHKMSVVFNLLIIYGKNAPRVQIVPDHYTAEYIKERMFEDYVYIRAAYKDGILYDMGEIKS